MTHEMPYLNPAGEFGYAIRFTPEDLADIQMGGEMFDASPDGQAEAERRRAILDGYPNGSIEFSGEWDA